MLFWVWPRRSFLLSARSLTEEMSERVPMSKSVLRTVAGPRIHIYIVIGVRYSLLQLTRAFKGSL